MMGLFDTGLKGGNRFTDLLAAHARKTVEALRFVEGALEAVGPESLAGLKAIAAESVELRRVLIDELHKTFITPLDLEDIFGLSRCFNDMVNYAVTTLEEMHILGVANDVPIGRMVTLMREQAEELELAMLRLAKNPRVAGDHASRVQEKEHEVERLYRAAVKDLFAHASEVQGLPGMLYRREVYRHISNMADRAMDAANLLGVVVMKLA